jgi:hypothetical protein
MLILLNYFVAYRVHLHRTMKTAFETSACSRCHGTGKYSFCERFRDVCFKCHGSGITLTQRGLAAQRMYVESCTVDSSEVKVGDRLLCEGMTHGGSSYSYIGTVVSILVRVCTRVTKRTLRYDGSVYDGSVLVSGTYTYDIPGPVLSGSWSTIEHVGEGQLGETIENITEYTFQVSSKYGDSSVTQSKCRLYRSDDNLRIEKALLYQASLTKQGKVRKNKSIQLLEK